MKKLPAIALIMLGLLIGMLIGYYLKPYDIFRCFGELNYQNITCYRIADTYHCARSDGIGYIIEHVYGK
jgi:hypothetical protein